MSEEEKTGGKAVAFIKGTVVGAAIGSVVGILFAPKSGKETRKDIGDAASKAQASAGKQLKRAYKELGVYGEKAMEQANSLRGKAKSELEKLSKQAELVQLKIKEIISSYREGDVVSDKDIDKALAESHKIIDEIGKKLKSSK